MIVPIKIMAAARGIAMAIAMSQGGRVMEIMGRPSFLFCC
jgi:hypothetical protein